MFSYCSYEDYVVILLDHNIWDPYQLAVIGLVLKPSISWVVSVYCTLLKVSPFFVQVLDNLVSLEDGHLGKHEELLRHREEKELLRHTEDIMKSENGWDLHHQILHADNTLTTIKQLHLFQVSAAVGVCT